MTAHPNIIDSTPTAPRLADSATSAHQPGDWWGATFAPIQVRNPVFWVYAVLIVGGAVALIRAWTWIPQMFRSAEIASIVVIVLLGAVLILIARAMDVFRSVPTLLVTYAFLWGALPACNLIAINANDAFLSIYPKLFGGEWATDWATGLTAGFNEELAKGLGFVVLFALAPTVIVRPLQAFIIGAFIGLGFQFTENFSYAISGAVSTQFGANATTNALMSTVIRFSEGLSSHCAYSAVFASGLFLVMRSTSKIAGIALMAFSISAHFVWDNVGAVFGGWGGSVYVLELAITGFAFTVWMIARRLEYQAAHAAAADAFSDVPPGMVDAVAGSRRMRRRFVRHGGERRGDAARARKRLVRLGRRALLNPNANPTRTSRRQTRFLDQVSLGQN